MNNEVVLKPTSGENVLKIGELASGNFEYVSNTRRTRMTRPRGRPHEIFRPVFVDFG